MGIKPRMCNDMGVCSGWQKQTFDKRTTHNVCHDPFISVSKTDSDGIRYISKANGMRERGIYMITSIHWCSTLPTTFTLVLNRQVPNNLKPQLNPRVTPHKAMGVGSHTTMKNIAPVDGDL